MTILELIQYLEQCLPIYGNVEVKIAHPENLWVPINEVQAVTHYRPLTREAENFIGLGKIE